MPFMIHLVAQDVSVTYSSSQQKSVNALNGVSFTVKQGEFVVLVGASGCGKSSLLNCIAGLQPVTSGLLLLNNQVITAPSKDCAMVFQSPSLMPWRNAIRNITYGLELQGHNKKAAIDIAQKYVDLVGLRGFEESYPHQLSGGMQQRVNVARALAVKPSLLLLDEPFSALDALTRLYMQIELQRIWQQTQVTAFYITHQISEAILLADRVFVMSARPGRIKAVFEIPLERPRTVEIKRTRIFNELETQIWASLKEEIAAMGISI